MSRTIGIEIEFAGSQQEVRNKLLNEDIPVERSQYDDGTHRGKWTVKGDGSVYNGGEVTSPVLNFDSPSDREQVSAVVGFMRDIGCAPSEQAGIHVHVGIHDMTPEQLANVAYGFVRHEDFLYRLASSGWDHMRENATTYAHPYNRHDKALLISSNFDLEAVREVAARDRYYGLNFQPCLYTRRGQIDEERTVEFRLFNSTMNPERIQAYMAAAAGLVKASIAGRLGSPTLNRYNCYPLGSVAEGYRTERAQINAAMRAMSASGRVLSAADRRLILKFWRSAVPMPQNAFGSVSTYHLPGWTGPNAVREGQVAERLPALASVLRDDQVLSRNGSEYNEYDDGDQMYDANDGCAFCGDSVDHLCHHCNEYSCEDSAYRTSIICSQCGVRRFR